MTITVQDEEPRPLQEGQSDAITVAFSDADADVCGVARIGRALVDGETVTSGLGLLFAGGQPVAARAEGGAPAEGAGWGAAEAGGVSTEIVEPLRAWHVRFASEDGAHGFVLDLQAASAPAQLEAGLPAGRLGGMEGYDQLVRVTGTVTVGGRERRFTGRGQRGHSWGAPDWDRLSVARTLGVWLEGDTGVTLTAVRPAKASSHADEAVHAVLLSPAHEGAGDSVATVVADPRLSTTYDADGRQRHAGLELYLTEDADYARRAAGEVACGTTLDLGRLRLDCAFFRWRMEGRTGVGRYDILRRAS
ncbi:MAG TPA: hypothetical protein VFT50_05810 [Baekduia sp.]|nr:hypothetical protein [Baekduia sp.]